MPPEPLSTVADLLSGCAASNGGLMEQWAMPEPVDALPQPVPVPVEQPAKILELEMPDFWPEGLDPWDNQAVCTWLLAGGWQHYELDESAAKLRPGTWTWRKKRAMDIAVALFVMPLAMMVMGVAALAILVTMGRPILFRQQRPGYLCRPFTMLKFRSMTVAGDCESPRNDAMRLTRLGKFLRKSSIDELPQLFNVLRGEMSMVGPRPQLAAYLPRMSASEINRHMVLPGITGASQVAGRNGISWSERFDVDAHYVEYRRTRGDLAILAKTVPAVLIGSGVRRKGTSSMTEMTPADKKA